MASPADSENEALLDRAVASLPSEGDPDIDYPVRLRAFRRNVRRCKIALAGGLGTALVSGAIHLAHLPFPHSIHDNGKPGGWLAAARWAADVLSLILMISCTVLFILSLYFRPFPARLRPADLGGLANMGLHKLTCVGVFIMCLASIVIHATPEIIYTLVTKRDPPHHSVLTRHGGSVHKVACFIALATVGSMRRGPKLRSFETRIGTGFGVRADDRVEDDTVSGKIRRLLQADDDSPLAKKVVDYESCSMLSFLTLGYSINLALRSLQVDQLTQGDLPMLEEWVRTSGNEYLEKLGPRGESFKPYTSWGLIKSLWDGRGWAIFLTFALETVNTIVSFVQVSALHEIIATFGQTEDRAYAYLMAWAMLVGQIVEVLLSAYLWVRENYILHNPVRMTLSSILYAKILRSTDTKAMEAHHLTSTEDEKANKGRSQVMNLLTIDTTTVSSMATYVWTITNGIVRLILGFWFMYSMLGVSALVGLGTIPLLTPVSIWISKKSYECDRAWARARDARTGAIKEFLAGVKVIKLNAFEEYEQRRIGHLRDVETKWQRWRYTLGTLFNIVADQMPVVAVFITFVFHTKVMGRVLEPATAFVAMTIFQRVKSGLEMMPRAVDIILSTKIALDRLKGYLNQNEVELDPADVSKRELHFDAASFTWPKAEEANDPRAGTGYQFQMDDFNLSLPVGKMTLVCGPLGAGKTLFLRALLGEVTVTQGKIVSPRSKPNLTPLDASLIKFRWNDKLWLEDSVAYAPQMSYIRHGTVRDNIVFGQPFWKERYDEVLRQCSLLSDLELFVDGDLTEVGEHGVTLSGGQKARINLARCIYSRAQTIYLDDVLSAVDAHTGKFIVEECFRGRLVRGRTIVLISHHVDLCLPAAEFVIALSNGRIEQACPAREAKISTLMDLTSPLQTKSPELPPMSPMSTRSIRAVEDLDAWESLHDAALPPAQTDSLEALEREHDAEEATVTGPRTLYRDEHQATGHVRTSHYWMMITAAGGIGYWFVLVVLYVGAKAGSILVSKVLEWWTEDPAPDHLDYYLGWYVAANLATATLGASRWVWLYGIGNFGWYSAGTKKIHRRLLAVICNAPLSFFETTPAGRILNIFGQDTRRIDSSSADDFGRTTMEALRLVSATAVVALEAPSMILVIVAFGVPLYMVANGLGKLRTNLRRLAAVADSPLISLYHDSIDGVVMLRAFGMPNVMAHTMKTLINRSRSAETWNWIVYNWVRAVVLSLSSVFITATAFVLIGRNMSAARAGFILSFAQQISGNMYGLLEQFILLEQTFVSAERINNVINNTEQEPKDGLLPPPEWPARGEIAVRNLSMRYADDLPDVLHDVSFTVEPGQRVGIVGATGSGKSTLALSFFRAVEPHSGSIEIDGMDIGSVALRPLRESLNMVAQDGTLPSGSLRNALDVSNERDDHEIYDALRRVHLLPEQVTDDDVKTNPFANLDTFVAMDGSNFSHGQRQLLCLARALLKKSKILVMDEATSSVDFEMDAKITTTIRECFSDTTMLVIAHRLATIVAYDRVLVLEKGQVLQYGRPLDLMKQEKSAFHDLCMAQGREEYDRLFKLARMA